MSRGDNKTNKPAVCCSKPSDGYLVFVPTQTGQQPSRTITELQHSQTGSWKLSTASSSNNCDTEHLRLIDGCREESSTPAAQELQLAGAIPSRNFHGTDRRGRGLVWSAVRRLMSLSSEVGNKINRMMNKSEEGAVDKLSHISPLQKSPHRISTTISLLRYTTPSNVLADKS